MKNKVKLKSILIFLLTIIIAFSVFPTTVFGATTDFAKIDYDVFYGSNQELSGTLYRGDSVGDWSVSMSSVKYITLLNMMAVDCTENELIEFSFVLNEPSFNSCSAFVTTLSGLMNNVWNGNLNPSVKIPVEYNKQSNSFSASYNSKLDDKTQFALVIYDIVPKNSSDHFSLNVNTFRVIQNTEQANNVNSILEWFKSLFDLLTAKFTALGDNISSMANSLKNSLTDLKNSMSNFFDGLGDRISGFFTNLGNDIKTRFTELKNNLSAFFSDVGAWFSGLGDRISGFFVNLGDNISSFFEKLWNRIYWGNENGASEYEKPTINNKLNDIIDTLNGYQLQLKDTISTINNSAEQVSSYLETGTSFVNGIINVAGVGFTALIVFGIVFVLARKVVGR